MWHFQLHASRHTTMYFTCSHANMTLGQSERTYYLSYFINIYIYIYIYIYNYYYHYNIRIHPPAHITSKTKGPLVVSLNESVAIIIWQHNLSLRVILAAGLHPSHTKLDKFGNLFSENAIIIDHLQHDTDVFKLIHFKGCFHKGH